MKTVVFAIALTFTTSFSGCLSQAAQDTAIANAPIALVNKPVVLVELFTSEGCSSCPPADKMLFFLDHEQTVPTANVITLGFHVDYWDQGGWRDRFSSPVFTKRQEGYSRQFKLDSIYTPQMIVDGATQFVGSNGASANAAILNSVAQPKGTVDITTSGNQMHITISKLPEHTDSAIYLAVAESGLTTKVGGGENSGSKLEHTSVVRDLIPIGTAIAKETTAIVDHAIPTNLLWKRENLKYVVFVQENSTLKILGAGQIAL